ncbi:MAG: CheR family methyltransferase [Candidatus Hydrogenedentes bacterium]|nr:CheR family methyltransferase [Candidatus Hydrogenedentota bacterium]
MEQRTFERFRQLVYAKSGIALGDQKETLVSARIAKRMRTLKLDRYEAYYDAVVRDGSGEELTELIDSISTNVTSFYREPEHFDLLAGLLKKWKATGQARFRIWCAAASTGEEPFTIGITAAETLGVGAVDWKALATDISSRVLQRCKEGVYTPQQISAVDPVYRRKYFEKTTRNGSPAFAVNATLRAGLVFRRLNLSTPPFPMQGPFDVVFCRNVMIYFDNPTRQRLVAEIHRLLRPGGYLMVGHAESLTGVTNGFKGIRPSVYVK